MKKYTTDISNPECIIYDIIVSSSKTIKRQIPKSILKLVKKKH